MVSPKLIMPTIAPSLADFAVCWLGHAGAQINFDSAALDKEEYMAAARALEGIGRLDGTLFMHVLARKFWV